MVEEKSSKYEERPATHNKRAQTYMLALAIFIVILFAVSAYSRIQHGQTRLFADTDEAPPRMQRQPPKTSQASFEEQVALAKKKLTTQLFKDEQPVEKAVGPQEVPTRLQTIDWPTENIPPPADGGMREQERKMVLKSRIADFEIHLGFSASPTTSPTPKDARSPASKKPASTIDQEIARVQALRSQIQAQTASSGSSALAFPSTGDLTPRLQPASLTSDAPASRSSTVVGQTTSSHTQPLPGQKLLPLTTVMRAVLDQKVMSDYVGPVRLLIVNDVYDVSNTHVLIPSGSKVLAQSLLVPNVNAPIQSRMGIAVQAMVLPNGKSIDFSRQAALDREGIAAVSGDVDYHLLEQFLGVAAFALISTGTSRAGSGANSDTTFQGELGQELRRQFSPLLQRYLSLVPTITLEPGTPMRIFLQEELYIFPWSTVGARYVSTH